MSVFIASKSSICSRLSWCFIHNHWFVALRAVLYIVFNLLSAFQIAIDICSTDGKKTTTRNSARLVYDTIRTVVIFPLILIRLVIRKTGLLSSVLQPQVVERLVDKCSEHSNAFVSRFCFTLPWKMNQDNCDYPYLLQKQVLSNMKQEYRLI